MSEQVSFLSLKYGNIFELDVHGLTLEETKAEIIHLLNSIDNVYKGVLVVHGYHKGVVLKNFIRNVFQSKYVYKKINVDASRTLLLIDLENNR